MPVSPFAVLAASNADGFSKIDCSPSCSVACRIWVCHWTSASTRWAYCRYRWNCLTLSRP